jgi:hypothetical protein
MSTINTWCIHIGHHRCAWRRGVEVQRASAVHGLWVFGGARVANALSGDAKRGKAGCVGRAYRGQAVMDLRMPRAIERQTDILDLK